MLRAVSFSNFRGRYLHQAAGPHTVDATREGQTHIAHEHGGDEDDDLGVEKDRQYAPHLVEELRLLEDGDVAAIVADHVSRVDYQQ